MSLFSKIILLLLSLIILIISCVYTHVKEIREHSSIVEIRDTVQEIMGSDTLEKVPSNILKEEGKNTLKETSNNLSINLTAKDEYFKKEAEYFKNEANEEMVNKKAKDPSFVELKDLNKTKLILNENKIEVKETIENNLDKEVKIISSKEKNILIEDEIKALLVKNRIIFKRASFELTKKSYLVIKKIAIILNQNSELKVEVAGHTDAKGADDVNQYFSLQRAKTVKKVLIKYGVLESRISARGYGESFPLVKNDPQGYSKINRRVEFNIIEE